MCCMVCHRRSRWGQSLATMDQGQQSADPRLHGRWLQVFRSQCVHRTSNPLTYRHSKTFTEGHSALTEPHRYASSSTRNPSKLVRRTCRILQTLLFHLLLHWFFALLVGQVSGIELFQVDHRLLDGII